MKALIYEEYGPIENLKFEDITKPKVKENEVLIKVHYTTVNRSDIGFRKAEPFVARLFTGLFKPKKQILGSEFSGVIEEVGSKVIKYKVGDEVFGLNPNDLSCHAEYIALPENGYFDFKPKNYTLEEAGGVLDGIMLAMNYIREIDHSSPKNILVNGATGSIGSAGVQLAKYYGHKVTAVGNTQNIDLVKSLGADKVIDYLKEDFTKINDKFDVVFDAVGKSSFYKCKAILKDGGIYYSSELGEGNENVYIPLLTKFTNKKMKFPIPVDGKINIPLYKKIIESGKYKAIIDKVYNFEDIIEATKYVETGEKTGNVLIKMV